MSDQRPEWMMRAETEIRRFNFNDWRKTLPEFTSLKSAIQMVDRAIAEIIARHDPTQANEIRQQPEWIEQIRRENRERIDLDFEGKLSAAEGPLAQIIDELLTHIDFTTDPASVPIGPGDVVQTPVGDTYIVAGLRPDSHVNVWFNRTLVHVSTEHLTWIGRARYWPDGSSVEGGGE